MNKLEETKNNLITGIQSVVTTRKITSIFTGIIMMGLIGVFQFISLGCDFSALLTTEFYLTLLYRTILVFLAYNVAVNFLYDKCMKHSDIQNAISEFKLLTKVRDVNFNEFLTTIYNPKRKKEAWRNKINLEITRLERRAIKNPKKSEIYMRKIQDLKSKLSDEYIDSRIDSLNVKYYHVLESDFLSIETTDGLNAYKTRIDYEKTLAKSVLKKIIPYIIMSIIMGAVIASSITKPTHEIILNLIMDLSIIVLRIGQGAYDTPRIISTAYLLPYKNRINILKEYIEWSASVPKSKSYMLVEKLESEIENKSEKIEGE